jgi:hypothetical protein
MANYVVLDENNIVIDAFVGNDENVDGINWESWYSEFTGKVCKRTSYNTKGGVHILGGIPFRYNYAGVGYSYDQENDAFIPPKPEGLNSWILDTEKFIWKAPVEKPDGRYKWDESSVSWIEDNNSN